MPARPTTQLALNREKLLYFVMLRQMETPCHAVRDAYQRLADVAAGAIGWDLRTVILDWLQAELKALRDLGDEAGSHGPQLMKASVVLSKVLKQ